MTQHLPQYFHRAPRYVLLPQDSCLIRLAGPKQIPWEEGTEIQNVSTTGLSFTAATDLSPILGERIRVEFEVPGAKQMACYAKVVRLQTLNQKDNLIAIEFELLNNPQKTNLEQGLKTKVNTYTEAPTELNHNLNYNLSYMPTGLLKLMFFISIMISLFCSSFLLFSLYRLLTQPDWINILAEALKF